LGFFFLVPLLLVLKREKNTASQGHPGKKDRGFLIFFIFSFIAYLAILYWIPRVMVVYGGMSQGLSILGLLMLAAFLAVFHGAAGMLIKKLPLYMIPVIWVAKDLIIEKIFGGFPWCLAGYSQYQNIYFSQLAEIGGIHLVTFLLISFNVLFFRLIRDFHHKRARKLILMAILVSFTGIYTAGYYLYRLDGHRTSVLKTHRAGIIQPGTDNDPLGRSEKERILGRLFKESGELADLGAEFVIWPEHSVSLYPLQVPDDYELFTLFAGSKVPLLAGFTDLVSSREIYNSAILFKMEGIEKYDKVHLTPFGEYVLFRKLLFFVKRITDEIADFSPGKAVRNLHLPGYTISTPICYEIIFPELVREFISLGGKLIVTISNDSWFGDTSAPYQHLAMAVFRCIENRRYLLRSTTNGISAVIGSSGEIYYRSRYHTADRFIGEFKVMEYQTFFTCCGYLFPYLCLGLLAAYFINYRFFRGPGAGAGSPNL
jgi:apolipoprotein N-acyltransferase